MDQEIKLRASYKLGLVQQGYSPTSVVSVLQNFLMDTLALAFASGGRTDDEVLFKAFRSAETEWSKFVFEVKSVVTMDDFHSEFAQFFLRYSEWRKWREENPPEEGPVQ